MVKPIPARFNPDILARDTTRYGAEIPLEKFTRLGECLVKREGDMAGTVSVELSFTRRKDLVLANGQYSTSYSLQCQRCLGYMMLPIAATFELTFVENEAAALELPDAMDPVILDEHGNIDVVDMLEDELLLQLPVVARHEEGSSDCSAELVMEEVDAEPAEPTRRPFEALKNLKKDLKLKH